MAQANQIPVEITSSGNVDPFGGPPAERFEQVREGATFADPWLSNDTLSELARAAVAMDHARSTLPVQDPGAALETWRAFVAGGFSLVASFDAEGRHFMLLAPTDLGVAASSALTPRERQVVAYRARGYALKYIAYELGLTASSISSAVASARRKLGFRSDVELIAAFSSSSSQETGTGEPEAELPAPAGVRKCTIVYAGKRLSILSFHQSDFEVPECLSQAERHVLGFLLNAEPVARIAERRGTSLHTVCNQVASIYKKIRVGSRAELVFKLRRFSGCR